MGTQWARGWQASAVTAASAAHGSLDEKRQERESGGEGEAGGREGERENVLSCWGAKPKKGKKNCRDARGGRYSV